MPKSKIDALLFRYLSVMSSLLSLDTNYQMAIGAVSIYDWSWFLDCQY